MKTKPIFFSTEMVQANSLGRKTQTRRLVPEIHYDFLEYAFKHKKNLTEWINKTAKYQFGDIIWVRETAWFDIFQQVYHYKADQESFMKSFTGWKPSIHMPKEAARQFLKIVAVKVERLQDISEEDSIAEGIIPLAMSNAQIIEMGQQYLDYLEKPSILNNGLPPKESYKSLWNKINRKYVPWACNPFVFVYEYELIQKPDNFLTQK